jgi:hypothetical protein
MRGAPSLGQSGADQLEAPPLNLYQYKKGEKGADPKNHSH